LANVKRLRITIDEDLDQLLERMAQEQRTSKAALIRRFVRDQVAAPAPIEQDAIWELVGISDVEPEPVDDLVYR
jgi:hypothetical protein